MRKKRQEKPGHGQMRVGRMPPVIGRKWDGTIKPRQD
jgi:hypothetical protein